MQEMYKLEGTVLTVVLPQDVEETLAFGSIHTYVFVN